MSYPDAMLLWEGCALSLQEGPPLRITFARFAGYENKNRKYRAKPIDAEDFVNMQKVLGAIQPGPAMQTMPPEMKEAIQWAESMKKKHPALNESTR